MNNVEKVCAEVNQSFEAMAGEARRLMERLDSQINLNKGRIDIGTLEDAQRVSWQMEKAAAALDAVRLAMIGMNHNIWEKENGEVLSGSGENRVDLGMDGGNRDDGLWNVGLCRTHLAHHCGREVK